MGDDSEPDLTPVEFRLAWFWIPLPHALPLPDRWILRQQVDPDRLAENVAMAPVVSSIVVFQREIARPPLADETFGAFGVASQSVRGDFSDTESPVSDLSGAPPAPITIVEVAVPVREPKFEGDTELADAVEAIQLLQRAVSLVTKSPIELVRLAILPFTIPFTYGTARAGSPPVFDGLSMMINTHANPYALGPGTDVLTGEDLAAVSTTAARLASGEPFSTYADLRREAMVQQRHRGNERLTVVLAAAAGEVLLDTVLLHLLWESRTEPSAAAKLFGRDRSPLLRSIEQLSFRLGGDWHRDGPAAVGAYAQNIVLVRNRVMHGGYDPSAEAAATAWSSLIELEHFIGDRLCSDRAFPAYPRTAYAWMGEQGLRGRGRWVKRIRRLLDDADEPTWRHGFARWRLLVDRELDSNPPSPGIAGQNQFYFDYDPTTDGGRWLCYDPSTEHAALFDGPAIAPPPVLDSIRRLKGQLARTRPGEVTRVRLFLDATTILPDTVTWQPSPELFPDLDYLPGRPSP